MEQPELFELVKLYQIHSHSRTCWKYKKNKGRFSYARFFTDRKVISKPLNSDIPQEEREKIMSWRRNILDKVKEYTDTNLYPAKTNIIDPEKENYQLPLNNRLHTFRFKCNQQRLLRCSFYFKG